MKYIEITSEEDLLRKIEQVTRLVINDMLSPSYDPPMKRLEAAKRLGVSVTTIDVWTKAGRLKAFKMNSRVYYKQSAIDAALEGK